MLLFLLLLPILLDLHLILLPFYLHYSIYIYYYSLKPYSATISSGSSSDATSGSESDDTLPVSYTGSSSYLLIIVYRFITFKIIIQFLVY